MSDETGEKLDRVRGWLDSAGYDGALLTSQPGVAWITGGLEDRVVRNEEPGLVWALVTRYEAYLLTTTIEAARLAAEADISGFSLRTVPWYAPGGLAQAAERLAAVQHVRRTLATDGAGTSAPGTPVPGELAALRQPLTAAETDRLALLGAEALEERDARLAAARPRVPSSGADRRGA